MNLIGESFLYGVEQLLVFGLLLFNSLLFVLAADVKVVIGDGLEGLAVIAVEHLKTEFVHVVGHEQHVIALIEHVLELGQTLDALDVGAAGVIDLGLVFDHRRHILLEGYHAVLACGVEQQQILEEGSFHAVGFVDAVLEGKSECLEELFVLLTVVLKELFKLGFNLLLKAVGDRAELAALLEQFTGDIERDIGGVHKSLYKAEVFGKQIFTAFHDHNAVGIELESALIALGIQVVRRCGGNEQNGIIVYCALGLVVYVMEGRFVVVELVGIEYRVVLVGDLVLVPSPQGHHAVEGLILGHGLIFGLFMLMLAFAFLVVVFAFALLVVMFAFALFAFTFLFLDRPSDLHQHLDGIADIVGILGDEIAERIDLEIGIVVLLIRIVLEIQRDGCADIVLDAGGHGVAVQTFALPKPSLVASLGTAQYGNLLRNHECGIEADAELTDYIHILQGLVAGICLLLKGKRTALGDGAKVCFQLIPGHADAVVGDGERPRFLVGGQTDLKLASHKL